MGKCRAVAVRATPLSKLDAEKPKAQSQEGKIKKHLLMKNRHTFNGFFSEAVTCFGEFPAAYMHIA